MKRGCFFILILLLVVSCQRDFDKISTSKWNPDLASPFIRTTFTLDDLIGSDTTFEYSDDSLLVYYYQTDSLIYLNTDSLVSFSDTSTSTEISLQDIKIEDFDLEASFMLGDILPHIDPDVADYLQEHDGKLIIIPPFGLQTSFDIEVPPVSYYESMKFSDGYIDIKIKNTLPIALDNVSYEVWDKKNNEAIELFSVSSIPGGNVAHDTIWLAGRTISNEFEIIVNGFSTGGSYPDSVMLDLKEGLNFEFASHDLQVVSGTAIIDEQVNYEEETFVDMDFDDARIKKIAFDNGILNFSFYNDFDLGVKIILQLSSAEVGGEVPVKEFTLPPAGEYTGYWDLKNMEIDLTGDSTQPYNRFSVFVEVMLQATSTPVSFDTSQRVHVDFSTEDVVLGFVQGNLGKQVSEIEQDTTEVDLSMFDKIEGDLFFDQAELSLSYSNSFGVPVILHTDFRGVKDEAAEEIDLGIDSIIIDYPHTPGDSVVQKIVFNGENSNIVDFLNFRPNEIIYSGDAVTNWNNDTANFFLNESTLLASTELKIPMVVRTSSLVFKDTSSLEVDTIDLSIGKGRFYFDIINGFPFNIKIILETADSISGQILDSLSIGVIPSAIIDENGLVTEPVRKLVTADFDEDFVDNLVRSNRIFIWARAVTADGGTVPVGLYADYKMTIAISLQMQISP
jgi:hypothetical protein